MVGTASGDMACMVDILAVSVSNKAELVLSVDKISSLDFPFFASCRRVHGLDELLWDDKDRTAVQQTILTKRKNEILN